MSKLYIVGDSFSAVSTTQQESDLVWYKLLAEKLGVSQTINNSIIGAAQDFALYSLQDWRDVITPDDHLIVILTHPGRFWFKEADPSTTKYDNIVGYEHLHDPNVITAIKYYVGYLQRQSLDTVWLENRLAWIAYNAHLCNWKKPLIIFAFPQAISQAAQEYPNIKYSRGSLTDEVSNPEIKIPPKVFNTDQDFNDYVKVLDDVNNGIDVRFNHLCLSNHAILAEKIYQTLTNDVLLDLSTGFKQEIFNSATAIDPEFIKAELDSGAVEFKKKRLKNTKLQNFLKFGR